MVGHIVGGVVFVCCYISVTRRLCGMAVWQALENARPHSVLQGKEPMARTVMQLGSIGGGGGTGAGGRQGARGWS